MSDPISSLKGITPQLTAKLKELDITNTDHFLQVAAKPSGRKELAQHTGVDTELILALANRADLARINGIAGVYADLLEIAGVDTVKELAQRNPESLHAKLVEINNEKKLSGNTPSVSMGEQWIAEAKSLDRILEY